MKLVSFTHAGRDSVGLLHQDRVLDLGLLQSRSGGSLRSFLEEGGLAALATTALDSLPVLSLEHIRFRPVISDPAKILCVGINYASHLKETGREPPSYPMIFTRFPDSQVGHEEALLRPRVSNKLDYEGELAVVIGRPAHHVKEADALSFVAGYSCYNDGSIRDWQKHTTQFTPGKNFPRTGAFGPWLVTADEIPDPSSLHLQTRLNGEVMQDTDTRDMIFGVGKLIEYCSSFTPLGPGDVLVTGTTGGVGAFRQPPVWMKPGDVVEIEISGIGILRNTIMDES
jgi:2-keto-4-pentenoate hydratase/2-oxohepta-3-ene-1,7-dioic acid hydratase in catechol pathway